MGARPHWANGTSGTARVPPPFMPPCVTQMARSAGTVPTGRPSLLSAAESRRRFSQPENPTGVSMLWSSVLQHFVYQSAHLICTLNSNYFIIINASAINASAIISLLYCADKALLLLQCLIRCCCNWRRVGLAFAFLLRMDCIATR